MERLDMHNGPLVSVVVPTYNRTDIVLRAVESVLKQTYPRLEVIVVDDGSTDDTLRVLEGVQKRDARVAYYANKGEKGAAGARNTGISLAKGDYVTFLDDDDEYEPSKIARQLRVLRENPKVDVLVSGVPPEWCGEDNRGGAWARLEFRPNYVFGSCWIMCKRSVLENLRLRCNYMEWRDFAFQLYENGFTVSLSSEKLVRRGDSAASLSKHEAEMLSTALRNARDYFNRSRGREEHEVFVHYLANCYKNWANYSLKRGRIFRAVRSYGASFRVERRIRNVIPFV